MRELNLYRVWEILNKIVTKQNLLEEEDIFVNLLGVNSNYYPTDFENFLNYYSFSVNEWYLVVFNDDGVPYEDYTNEDFNHIPRQILDMTDKELDIWMEEEVKRQLEEQRKDKEREKENIKKQIERLQKQLENE